MCRLFVKQSDASFETDRDREYLALLSLKTQPFQPV
jgi:hypothetical protein